MLCLGFLRQLPQLARRRFVIAGCLYVGGALGIELVLGYWTDLHGTSNVVYAFIDLVEESMEMMGAAFFLYSLLDHLGGYGDCLRLQFESPVEERAAAPEILENRG